MKGQSAIERFEQLYVAVPISGCWLWTGRCSDRGYGLFWQDGRMQRAHRIGWNMLVGPIPETLGLLHRCDVRCCVNPHHLFMGTQADNIEDCIAKGRKTDPPVGYGSMNVNARAVIGTDKDGRSVTFATVIEAAKAVGVTDNSICQAIRRNGTSRGMQWRYLLQETTSV